MARRLRNLVAFSIALSIAPLGAISAAADESDPAEVGEVPAPMEPAEVETAVIEADSFRPPESELSTSDWLRMKSGEWIKGNITSMRDGTLEFKSADLGGLSIGFGGVAEMYSPETNRYLMDDQEVVAGPATMQGDTITIEVGGQAQSYPRSALVAILEGEARERNFWNFGLGFGFTGRSGNTDSIDMAGTAYVKRETSRTRWNTKYLGAFASLDGDSNTNNHRLNSEFDYFLTPRLYLIPLRFDFYNDKFQNIDYRLTPAAGVGYELYKRGSLTWDVMAAPGYQYTKFRGGDTEGTFVTVLGTELTTDITKYIDFDFLYYVNLGIPDVDRTTHHSEAVVSFDIWGPLDFDVSLLFDRQESPKADDDGDTPKKNDFQLVVGLGLDF